MSYLSYDFPHTSYYNSDLRELLGIVKNVVDDYNKLVDDIEALNAWKQEHTAEYNALITRLGNVENEINTFETKINKQFAELDAQIQSEFNELKTDIDNRFATALAEFTRMYNQLKHEIEIDIANMKQDITKLTLELREAIYDFRIEMVEYLDERFDLFIQNLPDYTKLIVHNPVRGTDTTVQVAIDDLYNGFNVFGLTAREFDSLELTCSEFDNLGITAHEFDSLGYKLLHYPDPDYYMRDPFSGEIIPVKDVVMKLFALHAGTLTVDAFEALDLTCAEFDAKETTAFNFDYFGISA